MLIAVISDSHDNIVNIDKMLGLAKKEKIKIILHCGDICAAGVLRYIAQNFSGDIYFILGNIHSEAEKFIKYEKKFPNLHFQKEEGLVKIPGLKHKIALIHHPKDAKALVTTDQYDFIFYGHTHKPWIEQIDQTILANPGTMAGMFTKATFATWDTATGKLELKILELI